ncbi:alpha/beta hydrolase [Halosegnis marinus]|uniref:Alpha/beta hydrolase n=1 Tax=Halosegnis marinus TaxID=3034023 RepID=A0ABD5ZN46_9EURY|nr:alpha/beta hydrolase [Halosegnis sp. DT85]
MTDRPDTLDPDLAAVVEAFEASGVPEWHTLDIESARRLEDDLFGADRTTPVAYTRDVAVEGPNGPVSVRAVRPEAAGELPVVVFYHGGLWALGTLDSVEDICRELADRVPAVVLAADYRLAPEHPFPAGLDDCVAAYEWAREHADAFGGDTDRVSVAGTSAGGNLAAGVARRCRDGGLPAPERQALLYPMVDDDFDRPSYRENADGPLLTRDAVEHFWGEYVRSPVDRANPYVAPLRGDASGLAPATVVTAGFDPLRDEGTAYAEALAGAGVAVDHRHYPSMCHGFLSLTDEVAVADGAMADLAADLGGE